MNAPVTLGSLLDDGARWDCEYRKGLSNHLPMALVALRRLGAADARLDEFAAIYANRLEPAPPPEAWPAGDAWPGRFGDRHAWPAYRSLFNEWIAIEGGEAVLQQSLPQLMPGCGAAAFHGMIRTAYAAQAGHRGELADGLAYWCCRFLRLGPLPATAGTERNAEKLLRQLRAGRSRRGLIFEQMQDATEEPALHDVVAALAIDGDTLPALARLAARAYAGSGNFTALHLVTSCHAMRVLSTFLDEPEAGWRWYWQAFVCAVVAAGLRATPLPELRMWSQIVEAALASNDDHLIKLVDSCREEERVYGGDDWRRAASRALG